MNDRPENDTLDLAPAAAPAERQARGFWGKLKKGLLMTHTEFLERLDAAVVGRGVVDEETLEYLEESLIGTDLGVATTLELMERLKDAVREREATDVERLRQRLVDEMASLLIDTPQFSPATDRPVATLLVGGPKVSRPDRSLRSSGSRSRCAAAGSNPRKCRFPAARCNMVSSWHDLWKHKKCIPHANIDTLK